jgi:hypothetical protein
MKKEKLIITLEIEDLPKNAKIMDFQIITIDEHWLSRIFTNWKKVTFRKAMVTKIIVKK